jgi:hypothetical protein
LLVATATALALQLVLGPRARGWTHGGLALVSALVPSMAFPMATGYATSDARVVAIACALAAFAIARFGLPSRRSVIAVVPMAGLSAAVGYVALFTLYPPHLGG